jgi:predicted Zn-dependent protease
MGLIFAAMAGYDPQVAISFWQRMAASSTNQQSEFFSDHPSDETRIKNIQTWMPDALKVYKGVGAATTTKVTGKATSTAPSTTKTLHISTKK